MYLNFKTGSRNMIQNKKIFRSMYYAFIQDGVNGLSTTESFIHQVWFTLYNLHHLHITATHHSLKYNILSYGLKSIQYKTRRFLGSFNKQLSQSSITVWIEAESVALSRSTISPSTSARMLALGIPTQY